MLDFEKSARRDLRFWLLLVVGALFTFAGSVVDPATNCDESGTECAPWLVPIAKWMGIAFGTLALTQLLFNPRRGVRIDPATGDLVWWQKRMGEATGDTGRIHPSRIGRIAIIRNSESDDDVHLYDLNGVRQHYFDNEVIPWPYDRWAKALAERWPHIAVEEK